MVDVTIEETATNNPVSTDLTGNEPIETEISLVGRGFRLRQLSSTPLSPQTASHVLELTDQGLCTTMDVASPNSITIPTNATVAFPIGATMLGRQIGIGLTSVVAAGGVTIQKRASLGLVFAEQFSTVLFHKVAINTWQVSGELAAV